MSETAWWQRHPIVTMIGTAVAFVAVLLVPVLALLFVEWAESR